MSKLKTISDKLDYIAMGKLNAEQMEYICEINQEVNLKDREIERLNNIINELEKWLNGFETKEFNYNFLVVRVKDIQDKLQELKGSDKE